MKQRIAGFSCIALFLCMQCLPLSAQEDSARPGGTDSTTASAMACLLHAGTTLMPEHFMTPTVVFRSADVPVAGFLMDASRDSVLLQSRGLSVVIPFRDILKLQLPRAPHAEQAGVSAILMGAYLSDVVLWASKSRPGYYPDVSGDYTWFVLSNLTFGAISGALVYLLALPTDADVEHFVFAGSAGARLDEERRFLSLVRGRLTPPRLHVTAQMSTVRPMKTDRASAVLRDAGLTPTLPSPLGGNDHDRRSLNLLRKFQLTYNPWPAVALGAAYMNLSESAEAQTGVAREGDLVHDITLRHTIDAGIAVITVEPLRTLPSAPYALLLGAGAGAAFSDGNADASTRDATGATPLYIRDHASLDATLFSMTLFSELRMELTPSLSIGLTAEYVYVQPLSLGPLTGINQTSSQLDFSSWGWGLAMGLHF
ncbi:MAG: hypothetical protein IH600_08470 [Bacteroidetes bacterium]|nr:hypothetical protein [Bacteroidota bacterium]